jgi:beta-galactosidase
MLEARGMKDGKVLLTEKRETTGDPASIRLTPDRVEISADGEDVSVLRVEVLDKEGRAIPTADVLLHFNVTGEGKLIGVGNGDPNCQESDKEPKRSLFNGLAQVIVQSTRTAGTITVEAVTGDFPPPQLPAARLTISTKKVELRPSVP